MAKIEVLNSNSVMVSFSELKTPDIKKIIGKDYVYYGKKNDYPSELLRFYEEHAEHGAIVNTKSRMLWGKGISAKNEAEQLILDKFIDTANRYETWDDIGRKISLDCELFNSFYLQVVTDIKGNVLEFYHLQYNNCRLNEGGTKLFYSDDWTKAIPDFKTIKKYYNGGIGSFFIRFSFYQPINKPLSTLYTNPPYKSCISEIKSDIDITTFDANYVKNGFSGGTIVTFFNGEPSKEQKRKIREQFLSQYSSPDKAGNIVINYAEKGGQAAQIQPIGIDDLDKKFEFISKRYQSKILVGHNVTNPEIFGIKQEGSALGNRVSIQESHELFLNTYVKPRQEVLCDFLSEMCYIKTGLWVEVEFKQVDPIGYDLTNDQDLTQDERRELKGYEPLTKTTEANPVQTPQQVNQSINDNLKGLTGREMQNLMRIVRKFDKGQLSESQAIFMITSGFGLSEDEAKSFLSIDTNSEDFNAGFSAQQEDVIYTALEKCAKKLNTDYELLYEEDVHFHSQEEAIKFQSELNTKFKSKSLIDIIKDKLTGKKKTEELANIKTVYTYGLRDDQQGTPMILPNGRTRPFCTKMVNLTRDGNYWEFDDLNKISNQTGVNMWDYRGGFYTNPETKQTTPWCRHIWKAKVIIEK